MASEHGRSRTGLVCPARSDVEPEAAEEVEAGDDHQRQCDDRDVPFVRKPSETPMMMRNGLQKDEEEQEEQEEASAAEPGSGGGEAEFVAHCFQAWRKTLSWSNCFSSIFLSLTIRIILVQPNTHTASANGQRRREERHGAGHGAGHGEAESNRISRAHLPNLSSRKALRIRVSSVPSAACPPPAIAVMYWT